jgi:phenylacetate-coenzyme A ligase PaaK-like adenylate-forming protein
MFIVARQADDAIMAQGSISKFQLVVTRIGNRDMLTLKVELKDEFADRQQLTGNLNDRFQNACRVKIDAFEFIPAGTLPEKYQKILDERKWD